MAILTTEGNWNLSYTSEMRGEGNSTCKLFDIYVITVEWQSRLFQGTRTTDYQATFPCSLHSRSLYTNVFLGMWGAIRIRWLVLLVWGEECFSDLVPGPSEKGVLAAQF